MFGDLAVIIPARMGSSRIKNKVLLEFNGTNLLEWKIKQLLQIISAKNIFLSIENEDLKKNRPKKQNTNSQ